MLKSKTKTMRQERKGVSALSLQPLASACAAFTLVEMLVTLALLSLIVLALMTVFNSTQNAFRASLTETDILESGRLAMGLIADDLAKTTPSYGTNTVIAKGSTFYDALVAASPVNFYIDSNPFNQTTQPFIQYLPGTSVQRSNVLETFYMLSRQNVNGRPSWVGTGYVVDPKSYPTNSLYRFVMITNTMKGNPFQLFSNFFTAINPPVGVNRSPNPFTNTVNWAHVMDGVVDLRVRAYDPDGFRITNGVDLYSGQLITNRNTFVFVPNDLFNFLLPYSLKVYGCYMFSNTVPATVEVNLGVMEDAVLQRAEGMSGPAQLNYLSNHVGQVHLFRQRVAIRNVDPTAYQ